MDRVLLWPGKVRNVEGLVKRDNLIFRDDLGNHYEPKKDEIDEYIFWLADEKYPYTNTHFSKKLSGYEKLYELRPKGIRLFYFFYGKCAVIISACLKKNKKENQQDMERAQDLMRQCLREE